MYKRQVYVSSAGVYADSEQWPLDESSPTDPQSRHAGKADTEAWLRKEGIPFTSFRPTYIYGPGNYNPGTLVLRSHRSQPPDSAAR